MNQASGPAFEFYDSNFCVDKYTDLQENSLPHPCHHQHIRPNISESHHRIVEEQKEIVESYKKMIGYMVGVTIPSKLQMQITFSLKPQASIDQDDIGTAYSSQAY